MASIDVRISSLYSAKNYVTLLLTLGLLTIYFLPHPFLYHSENFYCILKSLLLINCPLCGITRATHCFLHGQMQQAINYNIAVIPLMMMTVNHYSSYWLPQSKIAQIITGWVFIVTLLGQYITLTLLPEAMSILKTSHL